jgi:hypothetical protein
MPTQNCTRGMRAIRPSAVNPLLFALVVGGVLVGQAKADFIGYYALSNGTLFISDNVSAPDGNWTLTVSPNTDGSVTTPDGGVSMVLTGGNSGSALSGTTDFIISAPAAGTVAFDWSYSSLDAQAADNAGYLLDNNFAQLADTDGEFGTATFFVNAGEKFGFRVGTVDNTGEPGILTISNFSAPVPEPGTGPMVLAVIALTIAGQRWRTLANQKKVKRV